MAVPNSEHWGWIVSKLNTMKTTSKMKATYFKLYFFDGGMFKDEILQWIIVSKIWNFLQESWYGHTSSETLSFNLRFDTFWLVLTGLNEFPSWPPPNFYKYLQNESSHLYEREYQVNILIIPEQHFHFHSVVAGRL